MLKIWKKFIYTSAITALVTGYCFPAYSQIIFNQRRVYIQTDRPAASYIYGSPIPTPILVNPTNGLPSGSSTIYYDNNYPMRNYPNRVILTNPNSSRLIYNNSTLVNPVIIQNPSYPRGWIRRSEIINNSPNYPYPYLTPNSLQQYNSNVEINISPGY